MKDDLKYRHTYHSTDETGSNSSEIADRSRRSFIRHLSTLGALTLFAPVSFGQTTKSTSTTLTQADATASASSSAFVHPGLLHTQADFHRMRSKVLTGSAESPWIDSWRLLLSRKIASPSWNPSPQRVIYRGAPHPYGNNWWVFAWDVNAAYLNALRWKIAFDRAAADAAVRILNAWSSTLEEIWTSNGYYDGYLVAGIQGYHLANVGEIMRSYDGWSASEFASFQTMMRNVFYPMNSGITDLSKPSSLNVYSNWDLCATAAVMAIGVLCDDHDMFNAAINYFKHGLGNGSIAQMVYYIYPGYLGQTQEAGRDQGHNTLSISLVTSICEMAWNQGVDLYGYGNNRILAACEYVAKGNLIQPGTNKYYAVPFTKYANPSTTDTVFSTLSQGISRPEWALIYNHYVNRRGLAAPYSQRFAEQVAPENGNDARAVAGWDDLGYGSLTHALDPIARGAPPSGLTAITTSGRIVLSWWGTAYATSYTVKRSTVSGGPYQTIAKGISDLLTHTDAPASAGTYYYVVTAITPTGETVASNEAQSVSGIQLDMHLAFNDGTGSTAHDATGRGHQGVLESPAGWVPGRKANSTAVALNGNGAYISLPTNLLDTFGDFTIATWVYWNGGQIWARIFDFGTGIGQYMCLTPRCASNTLRFVISLNQGYCQSIIDAPEALPSREWVHVAVTLSGQTGTLYVNGSAVGFNDAMLYAPYQMGQTTNNWLGRSQFTNNPTFNGKVDDFRIYRGALSTAQIAALLTE